MFPVRYKRYLTVKTFIIVGILSLIFTFFTLIFSGDLHHHDDEKYYKKTKSGNRKVGLNVEPMQIQSNARSHDTDQFSKDTRPPLSVARIAKYCNHPYSHPMGDEGLVPNEYKLLNVHVVIRHGDRSPINRLPTWDSSPLSCLTDTTQYSHVPKITNFLGVMGEAAKSRPKESGFNRWSLYPDHPTCSEGQLTGRGAIQHILNGIHYSERYVHQHHLFDQTNWHTKVVAHTTQVSRTFQSAIAFLYGMLPTFDLPKINLKLSPSISFCEERVFGSACVCLGLDSYRVKATQECRVDKGYQEVLKKFHKALVHITEALDTSQNMVPYAAMLQDGLSGYACHNIPPPCSKNGTCVSAKSIEAIWEPLDYQSKCLHNNPTYRKHAKLMMYGLLYRIAREMNMAIQNKSSPVFHLYSGHDTTVTPLITALGLKDMVWPGYASRIVFELYRRKSTNDHFIRVLQNGKVVTGEAEFCRSNTVDGLCPFSYFFNHLKAENLQSACDSLKDSLGISL